MSSLRVAYCLDLLMNTELRRVQIRSQAVTVDNVTRCVLQRMCVSWSKKSPCGKKGYRIDYVRHYATKIVVL